MPLGDYQISAEIVGFQKKITAVLICRSIGPPSSASCSSGGHHPAGRSHSAAPSWTPRVLVGPVIENKRIVELPSGRNPFALGLLAGA
jgi:hypothetical protein